MAVETCSGGCGRRQDRVTDPGSLWCCWPCTHRLFDEVVHDVFGESSVNGVSSDQ